MGPAELGPFRFFNDQQRTIGDVDGRRVDSLQAFGHPLFAAVLANAHRAAPKWLELFRASRRLHVAALDECTALVNAAMQADREAMARTSAAGRPECEINRQPIIVVRLIPAWPRRVAPPR